VGFVSCTTSPNERPAADQYIGDDYAAYGGDLAPFSKGCLYESRHVEFAIALEQAIEQREVKETADAWELVGYCWLLASDHLIEASNALVRANALSGKGDSAWLLARIYIEREMYYEAEFALRDALSKGIPDEGGAWLMLGIVLYKKHDYDGARRALQRAAKYQDVEKTALDWLKQLNKQKDLPPRGGLPSRRAA